MARAGSGGRGGRGGRGVPLYVVRRSKVHGLGVFALRRIRKGTRIVEYLGERITHAEADSRYEDHDANDNHTFLFSVDPGLVIDAGVAGNDARYINHSCDPNCESVIERRHVFIDALRDIDAGEELAYDYQIGRERGDPPNVDEIYACRCGSGRCRGTMLWPPQREKRKRKSVSAARARRTEGSARGARDKSRPGAAASSKSRTRRRRSAAP